MEEIQVEEIQVEPASHRGVAQLIVVLGGAQGDVCVVGIDGPTLGVQPGITKATCHKQYCAPDCSGTGAEPGNELSVSHAVCEGRNTRRDEISRAARHDYDDWKDLYQNDTSQLLDGSLVGGYLSA